MEEKILNFINYLEEKQNEANERLKDDIKVLQENPDDTWHHDDYECLLGQLSIYECSIRKLKEILHDNN